MALIYKQAPKFKVGQWSPNYIFWYKKKKIFWLLFMAVKGTSEKWTELSMSTSRKVRKEEKHCNIPLGNITYSYPNYS